MKKHARFFSLLLASALTAGLSAPALAANGQEYYLKTTVTVEGGLRSGLKNWFDQDGPFTREVTADVMYLMLSFNAGPAKESLGDILASEYGMSDILLYDHYVRRTAYDMRGATTLTLENFTGDGKTVTLSIQNGKLVVDDSRKGDMSVDLPSGSVSAGSPITLPRETLTSATGTVSWPVMTRMGSRSMAPRTTMRNSP